MHCSGLNKVKICLDALLCAGMKKSGIVVYPGLFSVGLINMSVKKL